MRPVDYIALSIPVFFALIGVELIYARWRREELYRLNDSVADLRDRNLREIRRRCRRGAAVSPAALNRSAASGRRIAPHGRRS